MRREGWQSTGTEIDAAKPFKAPFFPGERVRHLANGDIGIVCTIIVLPQGCLIECDWGAPEGHRDVWHFVIESMGGDDDRHDWRDKWESPYAWGDRVVHRTNCDSVGVVNGFRISERGLGVRVSWSSERWEWHTLCELEDPP
jgi:hypothetical protein